VIAAAIRNASPTMIALLGILAGLACLPALLVIAGAVVTWFSLPGAAKTSIIALFSLVAGLTMIAYSMWAVIKTPDGPDHDKIAGRQLATMYLYGRNLTYFLLPLGCLLRKAPPPWNAIGELCVTTEISADLLGYTGYGLMTLARLQF